MAPMIAMITTTITNSIRLNPREFFARLLHTDALNKQAATCETDGLISAVCFLIDSWVIRFR